MTLAEIFPDEDYRFHFGFQRGNVREFFRPTAQHDDLIAQRRFWLQSAPATYAALLPEGIPLVDEALSLARSEQTLPPDDSFTLVPKNTPLERCVALGLAWEPDCLLLKPETGGPVRLVAGCVCFPSSWSLADKIGRPIESIHGVVPGLNAALGNRIQNFLTKLRPGAAWLRANWGLSRSPELNQHPSRDLPRLDATVRLEEVWVRIEHQALAALPQTQGILFGIRIAIHPLAEIRQDCLLAQRLIRALKTMPEPMAQYKNIAPARGRVIELLA